MPSYDFLADLGEFPSYYAKFTRNQLYGAVAGLDIGEEADRYADRRGLFVLNSSGVGLVQIMNDPNSNLATYVKLLARQRIVRLSPLLFAIVTNQ